MASSTQSIRVGLVVGIIGFASVALFYALFDLLAARGALYTVDLLGKSVFQGLRDPAVLGLPIALDMTAITLYTSLHLTVSLVIGVVVTELLDFSLRRPSQSRTIAFVLVAGFTLTVVAVWMMTIQIRPLLPVWSIVVANVVAVVLAGTYLLRNRPGVWSRFGGPRR